MRVLFYDASQYFGECGKKLMWKDYTWVIICKSNKWA